MVRRKISRPTALYLKMSLWFVFAGILVALFFALRLYRAMFTPSVKVGDESGHILYIPTGSDYEWLTSAIAQEGILDDMKTFHWLANRKNLPAHVNPGRYRIQAGMNQNELINLIRSGKQEPVMLSFHNLRRLEELAGICGRILEADSSSFVRVLKDPETSKSLGFRQEEFPVMFIPDSYEFYWDTSPEEFVKRMKREYIAFWEKRDKKAIKTGLTRVEVSILASIVEQESLHPGENQRIAGVYMNRLDKGIALQSDPTLIFAMNDYSIRRVLNVHKRVDSPYNTYMYAGLPPGPICLPSVSAIDGVLNYESHNYLYFCVKPDFSGYHSFAKTLREHNQNARAYHKALNERKIYR